MKKSQTKNVWNVGCTLIMLVMILEPRLTSFGITSSPVISKPSVQNQQSTNCTTPSSNFQPFTPIVSPVLHSICMKSKKSKSSSRSTPESSENRVGHSTNGEKDVQIEHITYDTVRLSAIFIVIFFLLKH